jgi:hypothetical protein
MGRADETALNLGVAQSRNELRALTTQESQCEASWKGGFSRVESQPIYLSSCNPAGKTRLKQAFSFFMPRQTR